MSDGDPRLQANSFELGRPTVDDERLQAPSRVDAIRTALDELHRKTVAEHGGRFGRRVVDNGDKAVARAARTLRKRGLDPDRINADSDLLELRASRGGLTLRQEHAARTYLFALRLRSAALQGAAYVASTPGPMDPMKEGVALAASQPVGQPVIYRAVSRVVGRDGGASR